MKRLHMNVLLEIVSRLRRGQSVRGVARDLGLCRNTVRKYRDASLAEGIVDPGSHPKSGESSPHRISVGISSRNPVRANRRQVLSMGPYRLSASVQVLLEGRCTRQTSRPLRSWHAHCRAGNWS
jgi:transposase-like protein